MKGVVGVDEVSLQVIVPQTVADSSESNEFKTTEEVLGPRAHDDELSQNKMIGEPEKAVKIAWSGKSLNVIGLCRISPELRTVLCVALVVHLEFTAYYPVESLQSSLNSEAGLGTVSLACLYSPFFIFAIAAPLIVKTLTPKWTIFVTWVFDGFYIGANLYPTWFTLVPTAALTGAMTGPMWTAKDLYITDMSRKTTQKKMKTEHEFHKVYQSTLSFYNGIVFGGLALAQVIGQLISSLVLTQSSRKIIEEPNCGAFHCTVNMPISLNVTNGTAGLNDKPEMSLVYTLIGILLSLVFMALLFTAFGIRQIPFTSMQTPIKSTLLSCAARSTDHKMLLMIPQIVLFGFSHGIIHSDYTRSYITCGKGVGSLGYVMIFEGICGSTASVVCGRLVKYTGRRLQATLALCGHVGLYVAMWTWQPTSDAHLALYIIIPVLFGVSDVVFQTHILTSLALMFEDDRPAAFANYYTFRALSKALSYGLSGFVCLWIKLIFVSVFLLLAVVSFVILEMLLTCGKVDKPKEDIAVEVALFNTKKDDVSE